MGPGRHPNRIAVVSIDGTPLSLKFVRDGFFDAVISQPADMYSKYAVEYAQAAANGVEQQEGDTDHGSVIVKSDAGVLQDNLPSRW